MKRILLVLLAALLIVSCSKSTGSSKEYSPDELECFEGKVLIGTTWSKDKSKKYFVLKDPETQQQWSTEVSDKTFEQYKLGDTIKSSKPVVESDYVMEETTQIVMRGDHEYIMTLKHSPNCKCQN